MMRGRMMLTPARFDRLMPRMELHGGDPGTDCEYAICNSACDQRLKWRPQNVKEIVEKHTRDVIAHHEHSPGDHGGGEHLYGAIIETNDRDQHENHKQATKDRVSFQSTVIEPGHAIRGHQRCECHDYKQSAGVDSGGQSGPRQRLIVLTADDFIDGRI